MLMAGLCLWVLGLVWCNRFSLFTIVVPIVLLLLLTVNLLLMSQHNIYFIYNSVSFICNYFVHLRNLSFSNDCKYNISDGCMCMSYLPSNGLGAKSKRVTKHAHEWWCKKHWLIIPLLNALLIKVELPDLCCCMDWYSVTFSTLNCSFLNFFSLIIILEPCSSFARNFFRSVLYWKFTLMFNPLAIHITNLLWSRNSRELPKG